MDRQAKEEQEYRRLHAAACKARESRGRQHAETPDPWRTVYERDRDRVIHSTAFRRLEYKTQVFVNHVGDHHRTRLTHSLEVLQVARSVANCLDLNEALVEAIALAHDLGHPPYGHAGEKALDARMQEHGGFSHNRQSRRIVELLERRSPAYPGLNLTAEVRESLQKHSRPEADGGGDMPRFPLLEAQLVDLADSTAYHYHDVDDGIRAEILDPVRMERELPIWARAAATVRARGEGEGDSLLFWRRVANELLGSTIHDLQEESLRRLAEAAPADAADSRRLPRRCIGHSDAWRAMVAQLHEYLYAHMYYKEEVNWHVRRATDLLDHLFSALLEKPDKVPERFHADADSRERAICDYLAGMTDRYVERVSRDLGLLP